MDNHSSNESILFRMQIQNFKQKKKRNKQTKQTGIPKNMGDIDD